MPVGSRAGPPLSKKPVKAGPSLALSSENIAHVLDRELRIDLLSARLKKHHTAEADSVSGSENRHAWRRHLQCKLPLRIAVVRSKADMCKAARINPTYILKTPGAWTLFTDVLA